MVEERGIPQKTAELYGIILVNYNSGTTELKVLNSSYNLKSFNYFERKAMKEMCIFTTHVVLQKTKKTPILRISVTDPQIEGFLHLFSLDMELGILVAFASESYPGRLIFKIMGEIWDEFVYLDAVAQFKKKKPEVPVVKGKGNVIELESIGVNLRKNQHPYEDKLWMAEEKVKELEVVVFKDLKLLLGTSEELDQLAYSSEHLSEGAKLFYKACRKKNKRCCRVL